MHLTRHDRQAKPAGRGRPRPFVLIITGAPASGKTTLGRQLAASLHLPFLSKDLFKESLFDSLGWQDRDWSRRLGGASMALLFRVRGALLEADQSVALESNFYVGGETSQLREPNRYRGLYGAGQAAAQSGNKDKARHYFSRMIELAGSGDLRPETEKARRYLANN